ncbi:hypothetical protein LTR62_004660 [Meristemomyces frigidus]|uniref:Coenzyme Q-binding protein COQ10 START domain-containing protein n=1 Tax=Meristemomyces frigidus TaxID=1508187 RepID=A0AAN7THG5_9PEZI|nr:hypothetical protein LTR62_004660 [Meristemomyces frigidus]
MSTIWPPSKGLSTTHVSRQDTVLPIHASTRISAPGHKVLAALLDLSNYNRWNRFCPSATIDEQPQPQAIQSIGGELNNDPTQLQVGTLFTLHVIMNQSKPGSRTDASLRCTDISTPEHPTNYVPNEIRESDAVYYPDLQKLYRVTWKSEGGFVSRGLRAERFHEIIVLSENECEVRTWECQGGILARTVKWMYAKTLMDAFAMWVEDLKGYCEGRET